MSIVLAIKHSSIRLSFLAACSRFSSSSSNLICNALSFLAMSNSACPECGHSDLRRDDSFRSFACEGPTHRSHGPRKDFLYSISLMIAKRCDLRFIALAFFLSASKVSSVRYS
ncbi:hypothetical protein Tco_0561032 [Tanacetum coccineum]